MRPTILQVGGILYWVIQTRNPDTMVLKDADSTPSVAVRKNGSAVGDSVTITKRSATTGIYDCSYNPAAEVEGDSFTFEESAAVTGTTTASATYTQTWNARVVAVERGTDSANTTTPPTAAAIATQTRTELTTELGRIDVAVSTRLAPTTTGRTLEVSTEHGALSVLDPASRVKLDASQPDYDLPTNTELNAAIAASQLVITTDTADIPRYGDLQRFDQSANNSGNKTADVTITKLS